MAIIARGLRKKAGTDDQIPVLIKSEDNNAVDVDYIDYH
jgi:hypothetical protein